MMTCPNCKKPVSGRVCGYCGASLVESYFRGHAKATAQYPTLKTSNLAAAIIGIFGGLVLLMAAATQILAMFSPGIEQSVLPSMDWWGRILVTIFCGALFLIQQLVLRGLRFSMAFDGCWLFVFVTALGVSLLLFLDRGSSAFYGSTLVPWLLMAGCVLCAVSCVISVVIFQKPG